MNITGLDHIVLTVNDIDKTVDFYCNALDMKSETNDNGKKSIHFGCQKINLHQFPGEFQPAAAHPTEGSADLCFVAEGNMGDIIKQLEDKNIKIELGPVKRTGAIGLINSVYIRDPDNNLVEISIYL